MDGFLLALTMMVMVFVFMLVQKFLFPRLGIENNASSRAVLCFIVIAGSISLQHYLTQWLN